MIENPRTADDADACRQTERELDALRCLHEGVLATVPSSVLMLDPHLNVVAASRHYLQTRALEAPDVEGKSICEVLPSSLLGAGGLLDRVRAAVATGGNCELAGLRHGLDDGHDQYLDVRIRGLGPDAQGGAAVILAIDDVTRQHELQGQLRHIARVEAAGKLAGGVVHDLSNLLTAIRGYTDLMLDQAAEDSPQHRDLMQVRGLSNRAARLTGQLLALSRKPPSEPEVLDLNQVVQNAMGMLRRLIGEDVHLKFIPCPGLDSVRADPSQIEQVLINLVINARDAMMDTNDRDYGAVTGYDEAHHEDQDDAAEPQPAPPGSTSTKSLTIETANVIFDEQCAQSREGMAPGFYVMLAVTDMGCGMAETTRKRIFEPFFTTKELGSGTGLGLAMIQAIVRQHAGTIQVNSKPGHGATFRIYLPQAGPPGQALSREVTRAIAPRGSEAVLLVEDDRALLDVSRRILEELGYRVFPCATPAQAAELFEQHGHGISLLVTDLDMPGSSGPELYQRLRAMRAKLKALYVSGYAGDALAHQGVLESGALLIHKPFGLEALSRKVREALDAPEAGPTL